MKSIVKNSRKKVEQDIFGTTDVFVASKMMDVWNPPEKICAGVALLYRKYWPQLAKEQKRYSRYAIKPF